MPQRPRVFFDKTCLTCAKPFNRNRYGNQLEDSTRFQQRKYCCLSCANTRQQIKRDQYHQRARRFRAAMCETCGAGTGLHVHHKDENITNNDPSNLQTLCGSCHLRWHWANGKTMPKRQSVCKICGTPARKLDMCQKHYQRFRKYGDPCLTKRGNRLGSFFVREDSSGSLSRY